MCIECPELVTFLRKQFKEKQLTVRTTQPVTINYAAGKILFDKQEFEFFMPGQIAQQLVLNNGIENQIRKGIM